jgi:RHS repeat-associated protein
VNTCLVASFTTLKYTGKERDSEAGLDNFAARYDSSAMGRFMSPDSPLLDQEASAPQSWNLYSYVRNNPISNTDPSGETCIRGAGGAFHDDQGPGPTCAEIDAADKIVTPSAVVTAKAPNPDLPPLDLSNAGFLIQWMCNQCDFSLGCDRQIGDPISISL